MKKVESKKHCVWFLRSLVKAIQDELADDCLQLDASTGNEDITWLNDLALSGDPKRFDWLNESYLPVCLTWLTLLQSFLLQIEDQKSDDCWRYLLRTELPVTWVRRGQLLANIWKRQLPSFHLAARDRFEKVADTVGERDLLEWLLATVQPKQKKAMRYYATPIAVADSMIKLSDDCYQQNVGCSIFSSFAANSGATIVDPAAGSCVFARRFLRYLLSLPSANEAKIGRNDPSRFVEIYLLDRLQAIDKDPLAALVGSLFFALELQAVGVILSATRPWGVTISDALQPGREIGSYPLIVGNPPYAALTNATNSWVEDLLNGEIDGVSYRNIPGQFEANRKHWLHDDYIKFIRLGHHWLTKAGQGVLCLVTNRAFLDNAGCQVLRRRLTDEMSTCQFVDLQDSARDRARLSRNSQEQLQNDPVFGIGSGVAIAVFGKNDATKIQRTPMPSFEYCKLTGTRQQKLDALDKLSFSQYGFTEPQYVWFPLERDSATWKRYHQGIRIDEAFAESWSAMVTARDSVVVDVDRERLLERLQVLANSDVTDASIREIYFRRSRSSRYAAGDTRSWKLSAARRTMVSRLQNEKASLASVVVPCLYRALDVHWIYNDPDWLDWPRTKDVQSLVDSNSVALVTRRSSPIEDNYRYFAITRLPVVDGALRSDNRGSESVFNLYRRDGSVNFESPFLQQILAGLGIDFSWEVLSKERRTEVWDLEDSRLLQLFRQSVLLPEMVLCWMYAQFSRPAFQEKYAACLAAGFPRFLLPRDRLHAEEELLAGRQRISLELSTQRSSQVVSQPSLPSNDSSWLSNDFAVERRRVRFDKKRSIVFFNASNGLVDVPERVWKFRQGTHFVLEKLLKNRAGLELDANHRSFLIKRISQIDRIVQWEQRNA